MNLYLPDKNSKVERTAGRYEQTYLRELIVHPRTAWMPVMHRLGPNGRRWSLSLPWVYSLQRQLHEHVGLGI